MGMRKRERSKVAAEMKEAGNHPQDKENDAGLVEQSHSQLPFDGFFGVWV